MPDPTPFGESERSYSRMTKMKISELRILKKLRPCAEPTTRCSCMPSITVSNRSLGPKMFAKLLFYLNYLNSGEFTLLITEDVSAR